MIRNFLRLGRLLAVALPLLMVTGASAAESGPAAPSEALFLAQIVLLLLVGRLLGELMQRIGQAAVMGQLIAGVLLGPSVFGAIWPQAQHAIFQSSPAQKSMLDAVSQLGILLLLLLTGMEMDLDLVKKVRRAAISVSAGGIAVPFLCGFLVGQYLPDAMLPKPDQRLVTSLFLGTTLSIASVKIVAMVVREMDFVRRNVGLVLVASAIIDDTVGWIIIAITFSLADRGEVDLLSLAETLAGTALFLAASFTFGRRLVFSLIRWTNDLSVSEMPVVTAILVVMGVMALITHLIGVHTLLGAFVAGILIGESPILTRHIDEQLRGLVIGLFMPVFFALAGLGADLTILKKPELLLFTIGLILIASVGKFAGAFAGGAVGGLNRRESLALACGMNARGSTEVIVATIGLSMGALSHDLFTMIVAMAVATTMAMPPMLRWSLARLPLGKAEKARLEREAFEAASFVTKLERLLLAVDDSTNGKFASRLAGLIAGPRGIPATVLHVGLNEFIEKKGAAAAVKAAAETTQALDTSTDEAAAKVHVTTRMRAFPPDAAVAKEAEKGYDLLVIGVAKTEAEHGAFHEEVARMAAAFGGPLAVVVGRGRHLEDPLAAGLNILIPVRGNQVSRRAAELALALARASESKATALYVRTPGGLSAERGVRRRTALRRQEREILQDVRQLARSYGTAVQTAVRSDGAPEDAILQEAKSGRYDLVVLGVSRPAGDTLYFGKVAAAVLEHAETSILFVSS